MTEYVYYILYILIFEYIKINIFIFNKNHELQTKSRMFLDILLYFII